MLAGTADPAARVAELLAARAPCYAQADFALDTSDLTVEEVADRVLARFRDVANSNPTQTH
jgi:hypothetical protein